MKKIFTILAAAAALVLAGCDVVSTDYYDIKGRLETLEGTRIPAISEQISSINATLTALGEFKTSVDKRVEDLEADNAANKDDIAALKQASEDLQDEIDALKIYVDGLKSATETWANATFATIQYADGLASRLTDLEGLNLEQFKTDIAAQLETIKTSVQSWVNGELQAYAKTADIEQSIVDAKKAATDADDDLKEDLEKDIDKVSEDLATAKAGFDEQIKTAIDEACAADGTITSDIAAKVTAAQKELQDSIDALETRVKAIEDKIAEAAKTLDEILTRIQSIAVVADGSVEVPGDVTFEILPVSAAKALVALEGVKDSLKFQAVKVATKGGESNFYDFAINSVKMDEAGKYVVVSAAVPSDASWKSDFKACTLNLQARLLVEAYSGSGNYVCKASEYFPVNYAAPVITGTAKAKLDGTNEVDVTWVQLWADGPKWATINVGVTDVSATGEDLYGGFYTWGGSTAQVAGSFTDDYNTGSAVLSGTDDTATKLWGSNWRMPTKAELNQLRNYADDGSAALGTALTEWSTFSTGYTITGKGDYKNNSIFLPAAGSFRYFDKKVNDAGSYGNYWSSSGSGSAWSLYFTSVSQYVDHNNRKFGYSVRAVLRENVIPVTALTLSKTEASIDAGNTETLSVSSVTPSDATDQTVTWSSDNTAVATVDENGVVTGVSAGTATITATAHDGSGVNASCTVTVTAVTTDYSLIGGAADLVEGGKYLIAYGTSGTGEYSFFYGISGNVGQHTEASVTDYAVTEAAITTAEAKVLTLVKSGDDWAFQTPEGKYLGWTSGNKIYELDALSDQSSWTITFDETTHAAAIANVSDPTRLLQFNTNQSTRRFCCYTGTQANPFLFKQGKVTTKPEPDPAPTDIPEGALSGKFTVNSSGKQVNFSKGNLWCNSEATPVTWSFEDDQYSSATTWSTSHVSHFFWSNDATVAYAVSYSGSAADSDMIFTNATQTTAKSDFMVNSQTGIWRALSVDEWTYLFNTRTVNGGTGAGHSYVNNTSGITIDGTIYKGMFLFPDGYTGTTDMSTLSWSQINAAGIVFLPAAGYRNDSSVFSVGTDGRYWSSAPYDSDRAYYLRFKGSNVYPAHDVSRSNGTSVRLVTE